MIRLSILRTSTASLLLAASSAAQCLEWDTAIGNGGLITPLFGSVQTLATYDDGGGARLFAGGRLDMSGSSSVKQVARWDGSAWTGIAGFTAASGGNTSVSELGEFNDGVRSLLIASGPFVGVGGIPARNIAAFDGTVWSALGSGLEKYARALATFDDGSGPALYAGGDFVEAGGASVNGIAKWDGASWSALGNGPAFVTALCVFDDGSGPALYVAGYFLPVLAAPPIGVARFDGTTWSSVAEAPGIGLVTCLAVFDDGSGPALYAGGGFEFLNGIEAKHIAKWDGSTWSSLGKGTSGQVTSLTTWNDGSGTKLYAAGKFVQAGSKAAKHVAAWDGAEWTPLRGGLANAFKFSPAGLVLAVHDEGLGHGPELFVSGDFEYADGDATTAVARYGPCTPIGQPYCFGDGSLSTPCPCVPPNTVPNPSGGADGGCANSFVASGGKLVASGTSTPDTIRLLARDVTPAGFGFFISGNGSINSGVAADDGVRCAGEAFVRFGGQNAISGSIRCPNDLAGWSHSLSQISSVVPGSGLTRHYQLVYRDTRVGFCNPSTLNWTNAVTLIW